jgi:hypothetical protein
MTARHDAQLRVAALHPPLPELFAALRASVGEPAADPVDAAIQAGVEAARAAGVPVADPDLAYARSLAAGDPTRARNAGVLAAVRDAEGWQAVQRFGDPWCPSSGCYGRDGAVVEGGAPPFAEDCNCSAEPAQVR